MSLPLSHVPVRIGSQSIDLAHLAAFAFATAITGKGKVPGSDLAVVVVFSNHVYTERSKHGAAFDLLDHHGTRRSFDPARYAMSHR